MKRAGTNKLEWPDVFPYICFKIHLTGSIRFRGIKHIIVDEMQDYTAVQFAVAAKIFYCKKTVLGDFGQKVNHWNQNRLDDFKSIFPTAETILLNTSCRSTWEIIQFACKIKDDCDINPVERHGEEPQVVICESRQAQLDIIKEKTEKFNHNEYVSMGILCKTEKQAQQLYEQLAGSTPVYMLNTDSVRFENGVAIASITMTKGLEFDEVIIPFTDEKTYSSQHDRNLLYAACTRAMHTLTLTCQEQITKLLSDNR